MKQNTIWVLTILNIICVGGYFLVGHKDEIERLNFLVKTFDVESTIQDAQISDLFSELRIKTNEAYEADQRGYQRGFEAGKTQMGISFLHGGTMDSYSDGYHAAISQWGPVDGTKTPRTPNIHRDATQMFTELFHDAVEAGNVVEADLLRAVLIQEVDHTLESKQEELLYRDEAELIEQLERDIEAHDRKNSTTLPTLEHKTNKTP